MDILFIRSNSISKADLDAVKRVCQNILPAKITEIDTPAEALNLIDRATGRFDLVILDHAGSDPMPATEFLTLVGDLSAIVISAVEVKVDGKPWVKPNNRELGIKGAITSLIQRGKLVIPKTPDSDYIPVRTEVMMQVAPLRVTIHVRLGKDHFVKLTTNRDTLTLDDLRNFSEGKEIETVHVHRSQYDETVDLQIRRIEELLQESRRAKPEVVERTAEAGLEMVRESIERLGFSPTTQALARKTSELVLKSIGQSPRLAPIVRLLKVNAGSYITSHSLVLSKLVCAVAHSAGWASQTTFHKLVLAAIIHDLPLSDNELARISDIEPEKVASLEAHHLQEVKAHPLRAAELARSLAEIPADVDRIVLQQHEKPDGSGYPRGLHHNYIDPLSACFIISHDLLNYLSHAGEGATLGSFVELSHERYQGAQFRRIVSSLVSPKELNS
ncbi:hypothetical protein EBZ37_02400 [bacterium]|nr:hypothetical protein [bacterium]